MSGERRDDLCTNLPFDGCDRFFDRGFIGVTTINGDRLRDPVPADRLLEKP
jgi:hypothetical protein